MSRRKENLGFTLVEILVVIAIAAVITGIGTTAFFRMTDYWNGLYKRTEMDRRADAVFDTVRQDFDSLVAPALSPAPLTGVQGTAQDSRFWGVDLADDQVTFPILARESGGPSGPNLVTYSITRTPSADPGGVTSTVLVRTQRALDASPDQGVGQDLAEGVLQLRIEYTANGKEWSESWSGTDLPRAIRVSLTMADPVNPLRDQIARGLVFPVHVQ